MKSKALPEKRRPKPGKRGAHRPLSKAQARNWQGPLRILGVTLVWVISLAIVLTATVYGYQKLDAPVAEITVTGDIEHLSRERVEQWVNEDLSGGFFSLDMASLCEALEARPLDCEGHGSSSVAGSPVAAYRRGSSGRVLG